MKRHGKGFQFWMFFIGIIMLMFGCELPAMNGAGGVVLGLVFAAAGLILLWIKSFYYGRAVRNAYVVFGIIFALAGFGASLGAFDLSDPPEGFNTTPGYMLVTGLFFLVSGALLFVRAYLHKKWGLCGQASNTATSYSAQTTNRESAPVSPEQSVGDNRGRIPVRKSELPPMQVDRPALNANVHTDYATLKTFSMKDIDAISDSDLPNKIKGDKFENYCARLLKFYGFSNIDVTGGKNDRGADIICWKFKKKYIVQCKCYNHKVHVKEYDQTFSGRANYAASEAILLTNNYFTEEVIDRAAEQHIILWDREKLQELIDTANEEAEYED